MSDTNIACRVILDERFGPYEMSVDLSNTPDVTVINGVVITNDLIRIVRKTWLRMKENLMMLSPAVRWLIGHISEIVERNPRFKRDRRYVQGILGDKKSNNWLRVHGYAMKKKKLRYRDANPELLRQHKAKPINRLKGVTPNAMIIDERHEYGGRIYAIGSDSR